MIHRTVASRSTHQSCFSLTRCSGHVLQNKAISASTAFLYSHCLQHHVPPDADLGGWAVDGGVVVVEGGWGWGGVGGGGGGGSPLQWECRHDPSLLPPQQVEATSARAAAAPAAAASAEASAEARAAARRSRELRQQRGRGLWRGVARAAAAEHGGWPRQSGAPERQVSQGVRRDPELLVCRRCLPGPCSRVAPSL